MKIELHILQNFAPSNLNRDDTGSPKDCEFGGHRRARISSQCLKRAVRQAFVEHGLFGNESADRLAVRTKRLVEHAANVLAKNHGHNRDEALRVVTMALASVKLKASEDDNKTQYLLYIPRRVITALAATVHEHWDALAKGGAAIPAPEASDVDVSKKKKVSKSAEKKAAKDAIPKEVAARVAEILQDASKTPDLALFGRMIADNADWNTDAACQMAHAISTNRVTMEFDFYTAVDDLKPKDTAGSDMMGTVAFNSACFYRYACLDVDALARNLGGADEAEAKALTRNTVDAFLRASAFAIPTGKQNGMAALNLPSYLLAVVRPTGAPMSLANAFVKPVRPSMEADLITASANALEDYLARTIAMWGHAGSSIYACTDLAKRDHETITRVDTGFDGFVKGVLDASLGTEMRT